MGRVLWFPRQREKENEVPDVVAWVFVSMEEQSAVEGSGGLEEEPKVRLLKNLGVDTFRIRLGNLYQGVKKLQSIDLRKRAAG